MPLVRGVYKALKQIFETVLSNKSEMFRQVGLVEYPRKGVWSLVFVSNEKETEINVKLDKEGDPLIAVFMPCTPNPTTGFLMCSSSSNESSYLTVKVARGLGMVGIDTQARV